MSDPPGDAHALRAHARSTCATSIWPAASTPATAGPPDLWGYLEQAHAVKLAGSFAQRLIALRNRLAPHVLLGWHLWQLPLGDSHENDTWDHYKDNRLQWWLGAGSAAHLRATADAGVIGLLFGAGASGNTAQMTDGGLFYRLASRYEQHPLAQSGLF